MLIDINMNPSRQNVLIVAQDRSFLKPRPSGKSGTSQILSSEHAKASAALAASCKRATLTLSLALTRSLFPETSQRQTGELIDSSATIVGFLRLPERLGFGT